MFPLAEPLRRFLAWLEARPLPRVASVIGGLLLLAYAAMPADELTFDNAFVIGGDTRLRAFTMESVSLIFRYDYWWPTLTSNLYRPLTTLSFWFEYSFLGYEQRSLGYQCTNLLLHLLNSVLVCSAAMRLRFPFAAAFSAALVFAVHPIATEAVANAVGRSDLMATTAMLGALIFYLDAQGLTERSARNVKLGAAGLCALLGVMSKESAIVIPALIALHGLFRIGELADREKAKFWINDAVAALVVMLPAAGFFLLGRMIFAAQPGVTDHPFIDNPLMPEGLVISRLGAIAVWGMQLFALAFPLRLSSDYSFNAIPVPSFNPINETTWWGLGAGAAFMLAAWALWRARKSFSYGPFLALAYVIAMLPTSNLLIKIGSIRADRFHYLPSALFWLCAAGLAALLIRHLAQDKQERALKAMGVAAVSWTFCLLLLTHARCYDWRNNLVLWRSALANAPGSVKAAAAVANETVRVKRDAETARASMDAVVKSLKIYDELEVADPDRPLMLYSDYGAFSTILYDELIKDPAMKQKADECLADGIAWMERGLAYEAAMRRRWAERWSGGDLEKTPMFEVLYRNYATALKRASRFSEALKCVDIVLHRAPFKKEAHELKAEICMRAGRFAEAGKELMFLSVMEPDSLAYVTSIGDALKRAYPASTPITRDESGRLRLDINDSAVQAALKEACINYEKLIADKQQDVLQQARVRRTAKYIYGISLE